MKLNEISRSSCVYILLSGICWIMLVPTGTSQPATNEVSSNLHAYDQIFLSGFSLNLEVKQPTGLNNSLGFTTSSIDLSGNSGLQALKATMISYDTVPYIRDSTLGRYTDSQEFVVNLLNTRSVLINSDYGKIRRDYNVLLVDESSEAQLLSGNVETIIELYSPSDADLQNQYMRYILALGRGYSSLLTEIVSVDEAGGNSLQVKAFGTLYSPTIGEWDLVINPLDDYLVSSATFRLPDSERIDFRAESSALMTSELRLFGKGMVQFSDYRIDVRVDDYDIIDRSSWINTLASEVNDTSKYAERALIMDFRESDSEGMPAIQKLSNAKQTLD